MRIPSLYKRPSWQRFFSGAAIGATISWCIFLYMYGVWQEKYTKIIHEQKDTIDELNQEISIWQEEYKAANKRNIEQITVQKINVKLMNGKKYDLDLLSTREVEDSVKGDIGMMIAKDLEVVYQSKDLIKKIIENKQIKINGKRYRLIVKEVVIYTVLSIQVDIQLEG